MSGEARLEILTRIARAGGGETALERAPVQPSARSRADILAQFAKYAAEYRAEVHRVQATEVASAVQSCLQQRSSERVVVPPGLPAGVLPSGLTVWGDARLSTAELATMQAVVTTCELAIAETGTVVLDHGPGQGRRALTLIPDHHVCVVFASQVVDTLPEAVERLEGAVRAGRPLTWISGPSATSDIELSRVEGVHGPRRLDLVLVGDEA